jgi:hypothetical protein
MAPTVQCAYSNYLCEDFHYAFESSNIPSYLFITYMIIFYHIRSALNHNNQYVLLRLNEAGFLTF